ncbi:methylmalonyl Co-A mutase-associated GTPase MeaB [Maribacter sp. 4U21]|uniref:methylmalonyl Co-A mutase-associated GTPase MeaB n=1 Tax=Maribacter sp. 4U21 TaxID=1889779 RepID=UPI00211F142D|nr:methylmalonyl Co-A mutase-associated GTPase MeaB [Maribacter sp. 4U21]
MISRPKESGKLNPQLLAEALVNGIFAKDIAALSKAITMVESTKPEHQGIAKIIIEKCLSKKNDTVRIGITGVPGVGKSTFIERLGKLLTSKGNRLAVLTIDPSSNLTKGSILADKTRMQELVQDKNAFIRPSPSGDSLGGVARKTRESIILLEAAGYNIIIIETVGVGQSETAVHSMVDFFLLLKLAGAGDELQGIKRGIMEMADAIAINKADGDNIKRAKLAEVEFKRALHLFPPKENGWVPVVTSCSALQNQGLEEIWSIIASYAEKTKESGHFRTKRQEQNKSWLKQHIETSLKMDFYTSPLVKKKLETLEEKVVNGSMSPFAAAQQLLQTYKNS